MSGYNGRRGPNVSQYVANLNTINPQQDPLAESAKGEDDFSLFLDVDFGDTNALDTTFDLNSPIDFGNLDVDLPASGSRQASAANPQNPSASGGQQKMDFNNFGDFQFADYSFSNPITDPSMPNLSQPQAGNFPVPPTFASPVSSSVSPITPGFEHGTSGKKRKLDSSDLSSEQNIDEAARVAAEEDKRRRNTAASARFRIKKKQREQALEKTAKEMTERVSLLESRIQQLETENTWLKGLITEKNGGKASNSELAAMVLKKTEESANERSSGSHTDGVGTKSEGKKA